MQFIRVYKCTRCGKVFARWPKVVGGDKTPRYTKELVEHQCESGGFGIGKQVGIDQVMSDESTPLSKEHAKSKH